MTCFATNHVITISIIMLILYMLTHMKTRQTNKFTNSPFCVYRSWTPITGPSMCMKIYILNILRKPVSLKKYTNTSRISIVFTRMERISDQISKPLIIFFYNKTEKVIYKNLLVTNVFRNISIEVEMKL